MNGWQELGITDFYNPKAEYPLWGLHDSGLDGVDIATYIQSSCAITWARKGLESFTGRDLYQVSIRER